MPEKIKIIVADADEHTLSSLQHLFSQHHAIELLDAVRTGPHLLQQVIIKMPNVFITGVQMPGMNGVDTIAALTATHPLSKAIVLSDFCDALVVANARKAGAKGFLSLKAPRPEIIKAVKSVHEGEEYFCATALAKLAQAPHTKFSHKELMVLKHLCGGLTSKEIAAEMEIKDRCVERMKENMMTRLHLKNTTMLAVYTITNNLLSRLACVLTLLSPFLEDALL